MLTCDQCGTRMPQLPVRIEIVRETGPIGLPTSPAHGETVNFTKPYRFCSADHLYAWAREGRMMICNREPTPFEAGHAAVPAVASHGRAAGPVRRPPHRRARVEGGLSDVERRLVASSATPGTPRASQADRTR